MTDQPVEEPAAERPLRKLVVRGSTFELASHAAGMVMRLAGNLVLSRLLFPKAFGLSAEANFVMYGLIMFSDVGIRQCLIQSKRGDEPDFYNTAFSVQALRGVAITLLGLLSAIPVARWWFHEPELTGPLLLVSAQQMISGLNSTAVLTLRRHMRLGLVNALDLAQQVITLGVIIVWAYLSPSVWALIGGNLIGTTFYAIASHFLPVGYRNRFRWETAAFKEVMGFGRWILGSSSVTFFANQGDRGLFGRFLGATQLGVYQVAAELAAAAGGVVERLVGGVLYPVLSMKSKQPDKAELRRVFYEGRLALDLIAQGGLGLLCGWGGWVIRALWDSRYWDAAWILPVLCVRTSISCLLQSTEACIVAMGQPRYGFLRSLTRGAGIWIAIPVGYWLGGIHGLLWAVALSELPGFLVLWPTFWRQGILRIERELLAVLIFLAALVVGTLIARVLPDWHLPRRH